MSKNKTIDSEQTPAQAQPASAGTLQIRHVYLKGIAMRQPNSPLILSAAGPLKVDMQLKVGAVELSQTSYEVTLEAQLRASANDQIAYEVEVQQAGIFEMTDLSDEQKGVAIGVNCAHVLYPYVRSYVADTVTRGGFVPLHLGEVNFAPVTIQRPVAAETSDSPAQEAQLGQAE